MHLFELIQFPGCQLEGLEVCGPTIQIKASTTGTAAACPACGSESNSVHSYYWRKPADLPIGDKYVQLQLRVRRFRCHNIACTRATFAERLSRFLPAHARRTSRLTEAIYQAGLELGGQAAKRLLPHLRIAVSRDTVLRILRREFRSRQQETPVVVGIDDWAIRKRMTYGLIVVDLARRSVIDLLPSRSSETVSEWLRQHTDLEIVARDRSQEIREGITEGAPQAIQVADRFHLLQNLTEALFKIVEKRHGVIKKVVESMGRKASNQRQTAPERPVILPESSPSAADLRRRDRIEQAQQLHSSGWTAKTISEHMNRHPKTISRYLRRDDAAWTQYRRKRKTLLDPYKPYLLKRWTAGCHNGSLLYEEVKELGYEGKMTRLRDFLRQLRRGKDGDRDNASQQDRRLRMPSLRQLAFSMGRPEDTLQKETVELVRLLQANDAFLSETITLAREFTDTVNERDTERFKAWLTKTKVAQALPLQSFATSLEGDLAAVIAALEHDWSNGPTEGHINRLKMIKRQMYGRAKLDLLKIRMVGARPP